jgi:hypothetical protein
MEDLEREHQELTKELSRLSERLRPLRQQVAELDELFMATWRRREGLERRMTPVKRVGERRPPAERPVDLSMLLKNMTLEQKAQLVAALSGNK